IPMLVEQPVNDVRFDFAALRLLVALLVALVVFAIGIDIRRERDPFAIRRPHRRRRATRYLRDLVLVAAVVTVHGPNLTAGCEGELLAIRRPSRCGRRPFAIG